MPDPDAPNGPESVRYRWSVNLEEDDVHENLSALELKGTAALGRILEFKISRQTEYGNNYLVMLEGDFCCPAHCSRRFM